MDLISLLKRGYFPIELPPPFTTQHFANAISTDPSILKVFGDFKQETRLIQHDIPRYGLYRRTLGVPNPIHYARLAEIVNHHWSDLENSAKNSNYSFSKPAYDKKIRCITPENSIGGFVPQIINKRANARYILKTDVSQCYSTIYTHSIPWAIHTKTIAKQNRQDKALVGNLLDELMRWGHHGQTVGIPIGPDISFLIGEIILAAVDREIENRLPYLRGYRYIDDYEFSFKTREEANEALTQIKRALKEFELAINERKTAILELPVLIEETWVSELRAFNIDENMRLFQKQRTNLVRYFDKSFELVKQHPFEHVLNYSVQRLRGLKIHPQNWKLVQDFLLQCMMIETGTIRSALFMLKEYTDKQGFSLAKDDMLDVVNHQAWRQARNGYLNEVAWLIWAMIIWNLKMEDKTAVEVSNLEDSFVALLALDARNHGLTPSSLNTSRWTSYLKLDELNGSQWLLSYETANQGLLTGIGANHIKQHPCFDVLATNKVMFYDSNKLADLIESERPKY